MVEAAGASAWGQVSEGDVPLCPGHFDAVDGHSGRVSSICVASESLCKTMEGNCTEPVRTLVRKHVRAPLASPC